MHVYPQNKPDRPGSYPSHAVRPVHDRLGVRHPNKTLNKMVVEHTSEDKNEKVILVSLALLCMMFVLLEILGCIFHV